MQVSSSFTRTCWRFSILSSLLLVTLTVSASTCPHAEFIYPCTCRPMEPGVHVVCHQVNSTSRLRAVFTVLRDYDISWMMLKDCRLEETGGLFSGMRIRLLRLMDTNSAENSTSVLPTLLGLQSHLTRLDLMNWNLGEHGHQRMSLARLRRLETLNVQKGLLPVLKSGTFCNPSVMRYLHLERCGLTSLEVGALSHLSTLKSLTLNKNLLTGIQREALPGDCTALLHIDLSENKLRSLPEGFFGAMPNLRTVNLFGNLMRTLQQNPWSTVWANLERLWITNNPIECDNTVSWILDESPGPSNLYGSCAAPVNLEGIPIKDLNREQLGSQ